MRSGSLQAGHMLLYRKDPQRALVYLFPRHPQMTNTWRTYPGARPNFIIKKHVMGVKTITKNWVQKCREQKYMTGP